MAEVDFVLAFGVFQPWMYAFLTTLFSHNFYYGFLLTIFVIDVFLFPADHSMDDPVTLLILFVWYPTIAIFGAIVALFASSRLRLPLLIDTRVVVPGKDMLPRWTLASVGTFVFTWAWIVFFAGINFVMRRFSITGMSPIGGISDTASIGIGVFLLIVFAVAIIVVTVLMARGSDVAKRNIKYLWLLAFLSWTGFIHDVLSGDIARPAPGGIQLAVLTVLILIAIPLFFYIPSAPKLDVYCYHHSIRNALTFLGIFAALLLPALIVAWATNNISSGDHISVWVALVIYSLFAFAAIWIAGWYGVGVGSPGATMTDPHAEDTALRPVERRSLRNRKNRKRAHRVVSVGGEVLSLR